MRKGDYTHPQRALRKLPEVKPAPCWAMQPRAALRPAAVVLRGLPRIRVGVPVRRAPRCPSRLEFKRVFTDEDDDVDSIA